MLFPIHYKESALYQKVAKWVFVVVNAVSIVANLTDCVYFSTQPVAPQEQCSLSSRTRTT